MVKQIKGSSSVIAIMWCSILVSIAIASTKMALYYQKMTDAFYVRFQTEWNEIYGEGSSGILEFLNILELLKNIASAFKGFWN